ncbi:MAG: cation diffusion facilitator family transporter [Bacteroidota bacterium]|nr:cation diffusion facilitator family transporter [Bacteroidota bacterium]
MNNRNIRLQAFVLFAGIVLMSVKFAAWHITRSNTILSDALESIVNVVAGAFALYSLILTAKPRDREHPYGHGKVEYISAGIEGGLVIIAGGLIIWQAVKGFLSDLAPQELTVGIILTAAAGTVNLLFGLALKKRGVREHSLIMEASGTHLLSDAWSTIAMIAGLVLIKFTNLFWLDQLFAIAFAIYIIITGLRVFRRAVAGIMDEADLGTASGVIGFLEKERRPEWIDLHNFRMIKYGEVLHIDCHVTLPWYFTLEEAHHQIEVMEKLVNDHGDREVEFFVHMDPCVPISCSICALPACPVRRQPQHSRVLWSLDTVLADKKHGSWNEATAIGPASRH